MYVCTIYDVQISVLLSMTCLPLKTVNVFGYKSMYILSLLRGPAPKSVEGYRSQPLSKTHMVKEQFFFY